MFNQRRNRTLEWSIQSRVFQWFHWHSQWMPSVTTHLWNSNPLWGEVQLLQDRFVSKELQPGYDKEICTWVHQEIKAWVFWLLFLLLVCNTPVIDYFCTLFLYSQTRDRHLKRSGHIKCVTPGSLDMHIYVQNWAGTCRCLYLNRNIQAHVRTVLYRKSRNH